MKQIRVKFTGAEKETRADLGGSSSGDQKIPTQKSQSFKEKKKAQDWFQRMFSRKMSQDYDIREMEHATAVAAATFAIYSQDVSEISQQKKKSELPETETSLTKTKSKLDGAKSPISLLAGGISKRFSGSFKSSEDQVNKVPISPVGDEKKPEKAITPSPSMKKTSTFGEKLKYTDDKKPETQAPKKTPTFGDKKSTDDVITKTTATEFLLPPPVESAPLRPPPPPPPPLTKPSPATVRPTTTSTRETKAEAWERAELQKIKARYERLNETIDDWEKRKKMKARRKLTRQQHKEVDERKRMKAWEKYQAKMKYVDEIVGGARAQADEKRRNEELKAKEKANIIRTTGRLPGACPCF